MFGSSRNSKDATTAPTFRNSVTGIERAKVERSSEPAVVAEDVMGEAVMDPAHNKAAVAKKGFSFPDKPKPAPVSAEHSAHLYVGANIRLKGEMSGCDMMRIEGAFEGTGQARHLVLCPGAHYLGTAQVEDAEIEGTFEGQLQVRGRLFLRNKGRIRGTFSYGQLEIERGGLVEGKIVPFDGKPGEPAAAQAKPADVARAAPTAAAILAAAPPAAPKAVQNPALQAVRQVMAEGAPPKAAAQLNGSHPANPE